MPPSGAAISTPWSFPFRLFRRQLLSSWSQQVVGDRPIEGRHGQNGAMPAHLGLTFSRRDDLAGADGKRVRDGPASRPARNGATACAGIAASLGVVANFLNSIIADRQVEFHLVSAQSGDRGRRRRVVHPTEVVIILRVFHCHSLSSVLHRFCIRKEVSRRCRCRHGRPLHAPSPRSTLRRPRDPRGSGAYAPMRVAPLPSSRHNEDTSSVYKANRAGAEPSFRSSGTRTRRRRRTRGRPCAHAPGLVPCRRHRPFPGRYPSPRPSAPFHLLSA